MKPFTFTKNEDFYDKEIVSYLVKDNLRKKYTILLKEKYAIVRKKSTTWRFNHVYWKAAILLLMTASFLFVSQLSSPSPTQLAMAMAKETLIIGNQEIMRKDGTVSLDLKLQANTAFINKKYDEAIQQYKKLITTGKAEDIDYFYLGVSHLKLQKPQATEAIHFLKSIHDVEQLKFEIDWFIALAYVMEGNQIESSKALIKVIANKKYKVEEAKNLLSTLSKASKEQILNEA